jgi:PAS domain S-box-containing protein
LQRETAERKKAEEAVRQSEALYRSIGESIDYGVWVCAPDGRNLYASESFLKMVGITQEQCSDFGWGDVLHPDDSDRTIAAWQECVRTGGMWDIEHRFRGVDDQWHHVLARGVPIKNEQGEVTGWAGINLDIDRLKHVEENLGKSEERFRGLVEQAPVGIFVADAQGYYIDVNPVGAQMLGYTHEEICRMGFADVLAPEEMAQIPEEVDRLADGKVHRHEWRFKRKDDSFFIGEVIGRQLPDGRLQGILRDVTEHKKAEAMLKDMNEELELRVADRTQELANSLNMLRVETNERLQATEALREKERMLIQQTRQAAMGEMIGNIAHQWRQPLNTLGLHAQRINLFYGSADFNKEFLENSTAKTMEIIKHMSKTIDDFRNYFKPEKEKTVFKVIDAIKNTLSLLEGNFHNPPIAIDFVEHGNPVIKGYQNDFAQVFLNILNNARDAIIEWEITDPRITITICSEDSCTVVTVADNAGGIPDEIINKVFDPYFTTKGPQVGTGIGLFMSKTIIEKNMGGKLTVRNTDTGAEFRIEVEYGNQN